MSDTYIKVVVILTYLTAVHFHGGKSTAVLRISKVKLQFSRACSEAKSVSAQKRQTTTCYTHTHSLKLQDH